MCLAFPGKITSKKGNEAIVDFDGIKKEVNVSFVKAEKGDYVIVHAGFAIQKLGPEDAFEVLKLYEEGKNKSGEKT